MKKYTACSEESDVYLYIWAKDFDAALKWAVENLKAYEKWGLIDSNQD